MNMRKAATLPAERLLDAPQRRRLASHLERRRPGQLAFVGLVAALLVLASLWGALAVVVEWHHALVDHGFYPSNSFILVLTIAGFMLLAAPGPIVALLVRDRWHAMLVSRSFEKDACIWCGYSLESLEPEQGCLRCPECGADFRAVGETWVPAVILGV